MTTSHDALSADGLLRVRMRNDGRYVCAGGGRECRRYEAASPEEMTEHAQRVHRAQGWTAREGAG